MGSSELQGPNGPLHRVPLVRATVDEEGAPRLEEAGAAEWLTESFIQEVYGVDPSQLKNFRVSGNAMEETIRPGDLVRCVLWTGESLTDGAIYLLHGPAGIVVRRLHLTDEAVVLTAQNEAIDDQRIPLRQWRDNYRPLARALEVRRSL